MTFPQPILILFCILFPIFCLYKKKHQYLVIWLSLVCILDIFNSQKYMNLTAFKMAGIVLFPYLLSHWRKLWSMTPVKVLILYLIYLGVMGLIYGHIWPWEDPLNIKTGRDVPQWRSVLHLGSLVLEYTSALYLALQFSEDRKNIFLSLNTLIVGVLLTSFAALLENMFHFDFYSFFTGKSAVFISHRMKGFNYEPRGFSQACAYGVIVCLNLGTFVNWKYLIFIPLFLLSMFTLTLSMTGVLILSIGVVVSFIGILFYKRTRLLKNLKYLIPVLIISFGTIFVNKSKLDRSLNHIKSRSYMFNSGGIVDKFEIFDAAAVNFLLKNPKNLLFGTGPGLINIPIGVEYQHEKRRWKNGFGALPHMGGVLIVSNSGVIGLLIFISMLLIGYIKVFRRNDFDNKVLVTLSLSLLLIYFFQIRYLYYLGFSLFLYLSFKADFAARKQVHI